MTNALRRLLTFTLILVTPVCSLGHSAYAVDYHLVGWFNTFVPGGGEILQGNLLYGGVQAGIEVSTFLVGYHLSARSPMTLDGVPEDLPTPQGAGISTTTTTSRSCKAWQFIHGRWVCTSYSISDSTSTSTTAASDTTQDITKPLKADILQEIGIKYHMVNVYNAYREAAKGKPGTERIDQTSTLDLFVAPFNPSVLFTPAVGLGILAVAAAIGASYYVSMKESIPAIEPVNAQSNSLYALTYSAVFPVGSAAPEEMFYRGFLQNEFYNLFGTPLASIPLETAAYAFSHAPDDRITAGITGFYEGILTHANKGQLSPAIAFHFWADVMSGLYTIALFQKAQYNTNPTPLVNFQIQF